jgi:hypothetical protein
VASEAVLAPEADPFVPLPTHAVTPQPQAGSAGVGQTPTGGSQAGRGAANGTGAIAGPGMGNLSVMNPALGGPVPPNRGIIPQFAAPPPPAPELVGTLLGDQPSAVFRGASQLVAVPVGATFGGWKVIHVGQGDAVVKGMGRMVRLQAGVPVDSGSVPAAPHGSLLTGSTRGTATTFVKERDSPFGQTGARMAADSPASVRIPTPRAHAEGAAEASQQLPATAYRLAPAPRFQSEDAGVTSHPSASNISSGVTASDAGASPDNTALPSLTDTPLTPQGRPIPLPDDTFRRGDAQAAPQPLHPEAAPRTALDSGLAPFRRLVAMDSNPGPLLAGRAEIRLAAATNVPTAHAHVTHRRVRHHHHRHGHKHHRYSHRRPIHQQRYYA